MWRNSYVTRSLYVFNTPPRTFSSSPKISLSSLVRQSPAPSSERCRVALRNFWFSTLRLVGTKYLQPYMHGFFMDRRQHTGVAGKQQLLFADTSVQGLPPPFKAESRPGPFCLRGISQAEGALASCVRAATSACRAWLCISWGILEIGVCVCVLFSNPRSKKGWKPSAPCEPASGARTRPRWLLGILLSLTSCDTFSHLQADYLPIQALLCRCM